MNFYKKFARQTQKSLDLQLFANSNEFSATNFFSENPPTFPKIKKKKRNDFTLFSVKKERADFFLFKNENSVKNSIMNIVDNVCLILEKKKLVEHTKIMNADKNELNEFLNERSVPKNEEDLNNPNFSKEVWKLSLQNEKGYLIGKFGW